MSDYCERSAFKALVNALIYNYLILGSEVHINIYDDRPTITSPAGWRMVHRYREEILIASQFLLIFLVGWVIWSGRETDLGKLQKPAMRPIITGMNWRLSSILIQVHSRLRCINLNYGIWINTAKVMIKDENVVITQDYPAIDGLNASQAMIQKAKTVFANMGIDGIFGRSDIAAMGLTDSIYGM